jgi:ATP synthase protein I
MADPDRDGRDDMLDAIRKRESRRARWEKEGERPLWKNLSMTGSLGWLIVLPTIAGVLLGRWLDGVFGTNVTFSGALTFAGAGLGLVLVWRRMNRE